MKLTELDIRGVYSIERNVYADNRGSFTELYNDVKFENCAFKIKQCNFSVSQKNVVRGLHMQTDPHQAKIVTCTHGRVLDVIVDARKDSKTFGQYVSIELGQNTANTVVIPHGCLHGFVALDDKENHLMYFVDSLWNGAGEWSVDPFDQEIGIDWGINTKDAIVSDKDKAGISFRELCSKI